MMRVFWTILGVLSSLAISFWLISCEHKVPITVKEPLRGTMQKKGEKVAFRVEAQGDSLLLNGQAIKGTSPFTGTFPLVEGLGFAQFSQPDDPLIAVRSWHQGTYLSPTKTLSQSLFLLMKPAQLNGSKNSLAFFLEKTINNAELAPFVDNPIEATATVIMVPVTVKITVKSAVSKSSNLSFKARQGKLHLKATLFDLLAQYDASAVSFTSSGSVLYKKIDIEGYLDFDLKQTTLKELQVTLSKPILKDSGGLPSELVEPVLDSFNETFEKTVKKATQKVVQLVVSAFLSQNKPKLTLSFQKPIKNTISFEKISYEDELLQLPMATLISAQTARIFKEISHEKGGIMLMPACTKKSDAYGFFLRLGARFFQQLAFSAWDAGNLKDIVFQKEHLTSLSNLEFPYDKLTSVSVSLLLPPLLMWDKSGKPQLDLGGVQIEMKNSVTDPIRAWTAISIPIKLVLDSKGDPKIELDTQRKLIHRDVEFEKLSVFVDQKKILQLLAQTLPEVVKKLFSSLPLIQLPKIQLPALDGKKGLTIQPKIQEIKTEDRCWSLNITLKEAP